MIPDYLYTVDLGPTFGPRLERLAAMAAETDVEAFAALLLRGAIAELEQGEAELQDVAEGPQPEGKDDLPF